MQIGDRVKIVSSHVTHLNGEIATIAHVGVCQDEITPLLTVELDSEWDSQGRQRPRQWGVLMKYVELLEDEANEPIIVQAS